jgi:hypothetical protein
MKKFLLASLTGCLFLAFSGSALAANAVSQMATTEGGKHVAQCAQEMDKGVSECAKMAECDMTK